MTRNRERAVAKYCEIRAVCLGCLRGYMAMAVGAPMACVSCGSRVRELSAPLPANVFDEMNIAERGDLKLAGRRG
jgi:hypothetical protein